MLGAGSLFILGIWQVLLGDFSHSLPGCVMSEGTYFLMDYQDVRRVAVFIWEAMQKYHLSQ
jgi:hypothetical protein